MRRPRSGSVLTAGLLTTATVLPTCTGFHQQAWTPCGRASTSGKDSGCSARSSSRLWGGAAPARVGEERAGVGPGAMIVTTAETPSTLAMRAAEQDNLVEDGKELDQSCHPLVDALASTPELIKANFFLPGHNMGRGAPRVMVDKVLAGSPSAFMKDLPEMPGLDNLFAPEDVILEAETLAAAAMGGAEKTWFLANGSSCGIIASVMACVQRHASKGSKGGKGSKGSKGSRAHKPIVVLPRNVHKSAISALVFSGATPVFLQPLYDSELELSHGVDVESELIPVLKEHGSSIAAVLLVSPTYHGATMDLKAAARACHAQGVPLVVDEAHGSHLHFLRQRQEDEGPNKDCAHVPAGALQSGADLVVQSAHKTLSSLTQSAVMHLGHGLLTEEAESGFSMNRAVSTALEMTQSSSPSYLLLASLDAARWQLASAGRPGVKLLAGAAELAAYARQRLRESAPGVKVMDVPAQDDASSAFHGLDPLRLTVSFAGGLSGFEADDIIADEFGVYSELPSSKTITFAFGMGCRRKEVDLLVDALQKAGSVAVSRQGEGVLEEGEEREAPQSNHVPALAGPPVQICSPREAFFSVVQVVAAAEAMGRASAESVCVYPPGIPVLLPGELITESCLACLNESRKGGASITGCTDNTLQTFRVIAQP